MNVAAPVVAEGTRIGLRRERNRNAMWVRMFRVEAWVKQDGKCAYCHEPMPRAAATADHVDPMVAGGSTSRKNIKAACYDCNRAKGHMTEAQFLKLIKSPRPGDPIPIWFAYYRRRLWLRVERACKRIKGAVT